MKRRMSKRNGVSTSVAEDIDTKTLTQVPDKELETDLQIDDSLIKDVATDSNIANSSSFALSIFSKLGFTPDGTCNDLTKLDCDQMLVHIEGTVFSSNDLMIKLLAMVIHGISEFLFLIILLLHCHLYLLHHFRL